MFNDPGDGWDAWLASSSAHQVVMSMDLIPQEVSNVGDPLSWEQACAGGSYNHTELKDKDLSVAICGAGCTILDPLNAQGNALIDGNSLPNAPQWIGTVTARYGIPYGNSGEFFIYTDWNYRSEVNFFLYDSAEFRGKPLLEGGLRLGYNWNYGKQEVALYGRNITNRRQIIGAIDFDNRTAFVNDPRVIGVEFKTEL